MNIEPHNLIDPLHEKLPHLIRHEKLYRMIHRQLMKKWFQYFVLFFIIGSICSIIYSSFEESAPYHNILYAFNYLASFIFTIEYGLRIVAAPVQYASCNHAWKARLRYLFSFYGLNYPVHGDLCVQGNPARTSCSAGLRTDYLQADTLFTFLPDDWHRTPNRQRRTCYGLYCLWHHVRFLWHSDVLHRTLRTTGSLRKYRRRILVGNRSLHYRGLRRHLPNYSVGTAIEQHHQPDWHRHDCHSYRYHQLGLHEHADRKKAKRKKQFINVIYGTRNPT